MEILVTKRLSLRPPHALDADDVALHLASWNIGRMLVGVPFPFDRTDALDWISQRTESDGHAFTVHRERLIGAIDLVPRDGKAFDLAYWLAEDHWGQGFMSEALRAALGHVFARHPDMRVNAAVAADNCRAIRLQERLGFRVTGAGETFLAARQAVVPVVTTELVGPALGETIGTSYEVAA